MNSNVIFQIATIVLALALAMVLIVVFVIPEDNSYVKPDVNKGLIEVDEFDLVDQYSGSSTKGKILVSNNGELRIRLVADITVVEGDWGGFGVRFWDGMVVDEIYCDFNGDITESENGGYVSFYYVDYIKNRGLTNISVDSESLYSTAKHKPGSGTLVVDLKMDPKKSIDEIDTVECSIGIGSRITESGYEVAWPTNERFFLPTKDANKEQKGGYYNQDPVTVKLKVSDSMEPFSMVFEEPKMEIRLSPEVRVNKNGTYTFVPNITIPAGQGGFRHLYLNFFVLQGSVVSATYTDLESLDPKAYSYGSSYQLTKGSPIESDELVFTDSRTFTIDGDHDLASASVNISLSMSQNGSVNTYVKGFSVLLSKSGAFYDYVDYRLTDGMVNDPTSQDMFDFKTKVESGDVVGIRGDYTKISRFADIGTEYDAKYRITAVYFDKEKGMFYTKGFYNDADMMRERDAWIIPILLGEG